MKTLLIAAVCVGVASLSALAGSCEGCKDKDKKGKDAPKESAAVSVVHE